MAEPKDVIEKDAFEFFDKHPALTADELVKAPFWPHTLMRAALAATFSAVGCYLIIRFLGPEFIGGRKGGKIMAALLLVGGFVAGLVSFAVPGNRHPLQSSRGSTASLGAAFVTGLVVALIRSQADIITVLVTAGGLATVAGALLALSSDKSSQDSARQLHERWKPKQP